MWKSKKFIVLLVTIGILVVGATTGAVMASTDTGGDTSPEARHEAMLNRVAEIYQENTGTTLDLEQLQNAFDQARDEMRDQAVQDRLQALVDEGTITQDEADQYLEWLQSRPDIDVPGLMGGPEQGRMGGHFGIGMMGGGHHWGGGMNCDQYSSGDADA